MRNLINRFLTFVRFYWFLFVNWIFDRKSTKGPPNYFEAYSTYCNPQRNEKNITELCSTLSKDSKFNEDIQWYGDIFIKPDSEWDKKFK